MKKIVSDETHILDGLKMNGRKAYDQTLKAGIAVTFLSGKSICRVYPDGNKEVLGEVERSKCKVAKIYTLKK